MIILRTLKNFIKYYFFNVNSQIILVNKCISNNKKSNFFSCWQTRFDYNISNDIELSLN